MMHFPRLFLLSSFFFFSTNKHAGCRSLNLALNSGFYFFPQGNGQVPWQNKGEKKLVQFLWGRCESRSIRISCVFSTGQI